MKTFLLTGSILALLILGGCTKSEEAAPAAAPPAGVSQSTTQGGAQAGGQQAQARPGAAVSNQ